MSQGKSGWKNCNMLLLFNTGKSGAIPNQQEIIINIRQKTYNQQIKSDGGQYYGKENF